MSAETKQCPYCGETILVVAKKCKHCGEFLDESAREAAMPSAEEVKATKLRVQETDIMTLTLPGGHLCLTTKKIRGKAKTIEQMPDGRRVTSVKDIDALLNLVTSTEVISKGASNGIVGMFGLCLIITIVGLIKCPLTMMTMIAAAITLLLLLFVLQKEYCLVISIAGKDLSMKIKDRETANRFVEEIRKTKAEYELKAGL